MARIPAGEILRFPDPVLRRVAEAVGDDANAAREIGRRLAEILAQHTGVGLAAPQIGVSRRVILVDASRAKRPCPNHGPMILADPRIVAAEGRIAFREGCLSLPDFVAVVPRAERVVVEAAREDASPVRIEAEGFEAVVLQHEIDHLDGILFVDRVRRARDIRRRADPPA